MSLEKSEGAKISTSSDLFKSQADGAANSIFDDVYGTSKIGSDLNSSLPTNNDSNDKDNADTILNKSDLIGVQPVEMPSVDGLWTSRPEAKPMPDPNQFKLKDEAGPKITNLTDAPLVNDRLQEEGTLQQGAERATGAATGHDREGRVGHASGRDSYTPPLQKSEARGDKNPEPVDYHLTSPRTQKPTSRVTNPSFNLGGQTDGLPPLELVEGLV